MLLIHSSPEAPDFLVLLSSFVARIALPELNMDERMQAWDNLLQALKETITTA